MDPVSFDQLMRELAHNVPTTEIPAGELTPGRVLACAAWDRHVVTALPTRLNRHTDTLVVPVRHLHGGHSLRLYLPGNRPAKVYQARMHRPTGHEVPVVPPCVIPAAPAAGDRVVLQDCNVNRPGFVRTYTYDGERWASQYLTASGRLETDRYDTGSLRAFVRTTNATSWMGWHVYLPAAHEHPHLFVDGRPVPARTAAQMREGDVVLIPGGGRLLVEAVTAHADGHTLKMRTVTASRHLMQHITWAGVCGDRIESHDSGRRGALYATEPRPGELLSAADLHVGDTVIAAWGTPYSHVATVDEVWRQPVSSAMHVHGTTPDGRHTRAQTGFDNRYYMLRRATDNGTAPLRDLVESTL